MRLYNVYYLCKVSIDGIQGLDYRKNDYPNGQSDITVLGWHKAMQSYEIVSEIDFLKEEVNMLQAAIPTYGQNTEDPNVSMATYNAVRSWNYQLLTKMQAIIDLHESAGDTVEGQAGIDIKVPKCDSFKEYIQYLKDLDFVFSQCPLISQSSEEIVFNTVDVAPMWLSFFIKAERGQNYILSTLSKMTEVAMKVKANWVVVKQQEAILKRLQQNNEVGEEIFEVYKKVKNAMLDDSVTDLEKACEAQISNPEDRDRAARSIEIFAQLIEKGAEIYCSIDTPEEIKVQFPFSENAPIFPEGLLQLVEKKENTPSVQNTQSAEVSAPVQETPPAQESVPVQETPPARESVPVQESAPSAPVQENTSVQELGIDTIPITGTVQTGVQTTGNIQVAGMAQVPDPVPQSTEIQMTGATGQSVDVTQMAGVQTDAQAAGGMQQSADAQNAGAEQSQTVDVTQLVGVQQNAQTAGVAGQSMGAAQSMEASPAAGMGTAQSVDVTSLAVTTAQNTGGMPSEEHVQDISNLLNVENVQTSEPAAEDVQDIGNLLNIETVQSEATTGETQDVSSLIGTDGVQDVGSLIGTDGVQDVGNLIGTDGVQDVSNLLNTGSVPNGGSTENTNKPAAIEDDGETMDVLKYI